MPHFSAIGSAISILKDSRSVLQNKKFLQTPFAVPIHTIRLALTTNDRTSCRGSRLLCI